MDWTVVLANLFAAVPPTLFALAALVAALRAGKKVEQVHAAVNGRMDMLVHLAVEEARAAGDSHGREAERGKDA